MRKHLEDLWKSREANHFKVTTIQGTIITPNAGLITGLDEVGKIVIVDLEGQPNVFHVVGEERVYYEDGVLYLTPNGLAEWERWLFTGLTPIFALAQYAPEVFDAGLL